MRAVVDLALRYGGEPISTGEIAEREELSVKYLESWLSALRNGDIIRSVRGAKGGHQLARPPREITAREVFEVLEGSDGFVQCTIDPGACDRAETCVAQELWAEMYRVAMSALESTTLEDLAIRVKEKQNLIAPMYHI